MISADVAKLTEKLRKYKIVSGVDANRTKWPKHLETTIESVRELGKKQFDEYSEDISATISRKPWRAERKRRANELVEQATLSSRERVNEDTWRGRIEGIITQRLSIDVACKGCRGRLWRSEREVVPTLFTEETRMDESYIDLIQRQRNREHCRCHHRPEEILDHGTTNLFADCLSEEVILPKNVRKDFEKERGLKPDRVFSIRQSTTMERLLHREDKRPQHRGKTLRETIPASPFSPSVGPFLFPFLVVEAKSAKSSHAFSDIEVQSVLPIREMLKLQEALQTAAEEASNIVWDAAPLVWFLGNRGENWRLMVVYPEKGPTGTSYHVVRLWSGEIDRQDDALQFILILDFICEWARDMYRDTIKKSLATLASRPNDRATVASSDILSLNEKRASWQTIVPELQIRQSTPSSYAMTDGDILRALDTSRRAVRHICYIQSRVLGVCVTAETLDTLILGTHTDRAARKLVWDILVLLRTRGGYRVSWSSLDALEDSWTGKDRGEAADDLTRDRRFIVVASVAAYLSSDWEQTREINFVAVDESLAEHLCKVAGLDETWLADLLQKPVVDQDTFVEFFVKFKRHAALHNFQACATFSCVPFTLNPGSVSRNQAFPMYDGDTNSSMQDSKQSLGDVVYSLCQAHTIGRLKPSSALFRQSNQLEKVPIVVPSEFKHSQIHSLPKWPLPGLGLLDVAPDGRDGNAKVLFATTRSRVDGIPGSGGGQEFCAIVTDQKPRGLQDHLRRVHRDAQTAEYQIGCCLVHDEDGWFRKRNLPVERHQVRDLSEMVAVFAEQLRDFSSELSSPIVDYQGNSVASGYRDKGKGKDQGSRKPEEGSAANYPTRKTSPRSDGRADAPGTHSQPLVIEDDEDLPAITPMSVNPASAIKVLLSNSLSSSAKPRSPAPAASPPRSATESPITAAVGSSTSATSDTPSPSPVGAKRRSRKTSSTGTGIQGMHRSSTSSLGDPDEGNTIRRSRRVSSRLSSDQN